MPSESASECRRPVHILPVDRQLVIQISEAPKRLRLCKDEIRSTMDHFHKCQRVIALRSQFRWRDAPIESEWSNALREREFGFRWIS